MPDQRTRRKFLLILTGACLPIFVWAAVAPVDRGTWALENGIVFLAIATLFATRKRLPLSLVSYTLIAVYLCLHEVGSHYTYAQVPYDDWCRSLLGFSLDEALGFERNMYDRFIHFSYGLLLAYPLREIVLRIADMKGFWGYFLPLDVTMSTSMIYELLEWAAALVFGQGMEIAYLGTQGDPWDAHKDMLLASIGALISMSVTAFINWRLQHDFAREWNASLSVRHPRPAGEEAIARMTRKRKRG
jgi:putative membrane protein